jgi:hypothetical protein
MADCAFLVRVDAHFEGRLRSGEVHALFEHLPDCPTCRDRYERQLVVEALDPQAPGPRTRLRRGLPLVVPPRTAIAATVAAFGIAAGVALVVLGRGRQNEGFSLRGKAGDSGAPTRVEIFRIAPGTAARRVDEAIQHDDELAFAYANPTGKARILVFAVDEHRHVYWYYPAWTDPKDAPLAVPIRTSKELVEMQEAVAQPIDASRITLFAVFTDRPVDVREVEARVATSSTPGHALGLPDAIETMRTLEVR